MQQPLKAVGSTGAAGLLLFVSARICFDDLLNGPDLQPTFSEISLKSEFPPPSGWTALATADA